jgi:F-type H+-transporting ATPase subunit delta
MAQAPAARRYARALFDLARDEGRVDAIQADLTEIARLFERREEYAAMLSPYDITSSNREKAWRALLDGKADALTLRFILFLIAKGRITILEDIVGAFKTMYFEAKGFVAAQVISAHPLPDTQVNAIVGHFEKRIGKTIKAVRELDPSLLGGFQVRFGDVVHDYSINHQLERLHRRLVTA